MLGQRHAPIDQDSSRRPAGRRSLAVGVTALIGAVVIGLLSVPSLGAVPLTGAGTGPTWDAGTAAAATGSGAFACGTTANVTMASGFANSGLGFAEDWNSSPAVNEVFAGGITPDSALSIHSGPGGIATTVTFSYELVRPILLVNYIDPSSSMTFGNGITVLDWNTAITGATPTITANGIALNGTGLSTEGWAVQVNGTFGPTSGPLTFTYATTADNTSGFTVVMPSGTECEPVTPPAPEPTPARFTG